ncbi:hypothetical protein JCM10450v2_002836 [Rhodotorula kratochvilovae]
MPALAGLAKVPSRLRRLAKTPWDVQFLTNPTFVSWLEGHLGASPLVNDEPLVDYVRARLPPKPLRYAPSASDLPTTAPSPVPSSSSASPSPSPPPPAAKPASPPPVMSFDAGFDDVLDMNSYAAAEPNGLDDFADAAAFRAPSPVEPALYQALSPARNANGRTPSPFAYNPGAIAPFTAPATGGFFSRTASPAFTSSGALADPTVASSSLAPTADLIHRGRASHANSPVTAGAQATPWNGFFAAGAGVANHVPPGALFDPAAVAGEASGPTMTITPSVISAPPPPSASPPPAKPAPKNKPVASTSSSAASSSKGRSASPAVTKRAPAQAVSSYSSEHWTSFVPKIRAHLDAKRLSRTPVASAQFLVRNLHDLFTYADRASTSSPWGDASDVPPEGRAEVLSALLSYAKEDFWRAWVAEGASAAAGAGGGKGKEKEAAPAPAAKSDGLELLQCWLEGASALVSMSSKDKEAAKARPDPKERKKKELEAATLVLVLQVLAKLPLSFDHLLAYMALPKRVKRISDRARDGAAKAAATQLVVKWGKLQEAARAGGSSSTAAAGKRKADDANGPAKKAKTTTTTTTTTVKKPVAQPNPLGKALPSFKKAPAAAPPPAGRSALAAALEQLNARKAAPPAPPAPAPAAAQPAASTAGAAPAAAPRKGTGKPGGTAGNVGERVRKSVRWAPEGELEKIKLIEKAIYADEDGAEGATVTAEGESLDESLHLMQEQEGLSLAMHFEEEELIEEIDWYEPVDVVIPDTEDFAPLREPKKSSEPELYPETTPMEVDSAPPESPSEPPASELDVPITPDDEIKRIPLDASLKNDPEVIQTIEDAQLSRPPVGGFASNDQISALLSQLSASGLVDALGGGAPVPALTNPHAPPIGAGAEVQPPPAQISAEALEALRSYPPEQVAAIVQSQPGMAGLDLAALGIVPAPMQPPVPHRLPPGFEAQPQYLPQQQGYVPPGFAAQPYNGYVPPSAQQHVPPAWGAPAAADPYNGYQPPVGAHAGGGYVPHPQHGTASAVPPVTPRKAMRGKKDVPCKFFRSRGRCDWGDRLPLRCLLNPATASPRRLSPVVAIDQQTFTSVSEQDDLCGLSSLVVIAAPGLAYSDLALLPSSSSSAIRAALADDEGSSITLPYVPTRQSGAHAPASRLARQFAACEGGKERIAVKLVKGLEETDASSAEDRESRRAVMHKLDDFVRSLSDSPSPRAVVISAALPSLPKAKKAPCAHAHAKRQLANEDAYVEELLEELAAEDAGDDASLDEMLQTMEAVEDAAVLDRPVVDDGAAPAPAQAQTEGVTELTEAEYAAAVDPYLADADGDAWDGSILDVTASLQQGDGDDDEGAGNGTSIFQPKEGAGLFHRYVFFTPALILALLVTIFLLIPTVLVGASALLAIETPQGLEGKMVGSVGLDPSKAQ